MKKLLLMKTALLLCALIVGSSNLWADESTLTPTSSKIAPSDDHFTVTYGGSGTATTWGGNDCVRIYANNTITFASNNGEKITQITFTGTVNANSKGKYPTSMSANVGTITPSTISATGETDFSWTYATGTESVTLTIGGSAGNIDLSGGDYVITYTPSAGSDPSISASNVNIAQDATNGSIAYTLKNATGSVTASVTTGDWLTLGSITSSAVSFTCSANTGAERNATVTLSFTGATDKVVTITQAAKTVAAPTYNPEGGSYMQGTNIAISSAGNTIYYNLTTDGSTPANPTNASTEYTAPIVLGSGTTKIKAIAYDTYGNASGVITRTYTGIALASLPFSWTGTSSAGKDDLAEQTGVAVNLASDYAASNKPYRLKFDDAGKYVIIYTDAKPEVVYFTAKLLGGKADTGSKIKVQGSDDGLSFTDIEEFTMKGAANATFEFTTTNTFATSHRAVKLVMSSKDANVGVGTICVSCIPLTPAKTYTTLTSAYALDFTNVEGLKAYIATTVSGGNVQMTQVNKVPAGTGLVLKATTPGSAVNVPVFDGTSADDVSGNKMKGSATATTAIEENGGYILSNGVFQPATAGTLAAGKAYLNIAVAAGARSLEMSFDGEDVTAIESVKSHNAAKDEYFNLAGQRVAQPTKGLYIVNGKKIIVK